VTQKRFLSIALVVILVLVMGLLVLYLQLQKPITTVGADMPTGLDFQFQLFGPSTQDRFSQPSDVAMDVDGNIYVTDTLKDRVVVFDPKGKFVRTFPTGVKRPLGIDVDAAGTVYVASKRSDAVVAYDRKGKVIRQYAVFAPLNVTEERGRIYITTMGPIVSFDAKTGTDRKIIGWQGRGKDDFAWPQGIDSRDGKLFVADSNNLRLKVLKTDGTIEWVYGKPSTEAAYVPAQGRMFGIPSGIALDEQGNMLVVDAFRDRIYAFSSKHKEIASWGGTRGDAEGQFDHPSGIAYGGAGKLLVADKFNDRVQVFRVSIPGNTQAQRFNLNRLICLVPLLLLLIAIVVYVVRRLSARRAEQANAEANEG